MTGKRGLAVAGAVLWLVGLILTIVGMNIHTDTGKWMTLAGNILFLFGLLLEGVLWFRRKREEEEERRE